MYEKAKVGIRNFIVTSKREINGFNDLVVLIVHFDKRGRFNLDFRVIF